MTVFRSKAEERCAEIQKRERGRKQELDDATRLRLEKTARLRQLRLAKEAEDAAAKQATHDLEAAGKSAFKKAPRSALSIFSGPRQPSHDLGFPVQGHARESRDCRLDCAARRGSAGCFVSGSKRVGERHESR